MTQTTPNTPATGQQGFTLIEIIAVLVILGILSAVAVPKYMDMQNEARQKGLESLVSAAQSNLHMLYGKQLLLTDGNTSTAWTNTVNNATQDGGVCQDISTDGWLDEATISCSGATADDYITITATDTEGSLTAEGNFTDPTTQTMSSST
jgi:prepilin-type N-terminal cleavage/methylation domain-containing protein